MWLLRVAISEPSKMNFVRPCTTVHIPTTDRSRPTETQTEERESEERHSHSSIWNWREGPWKVREIKRIQSGHGRTKPWLASRPISPSSVAFCHFCRNWNYSNTSWNLVPIFGRLETPPGVDSKSPKIGTRFQLERHKNSAKQVYKVTSKRNWNVQKEPHQNRYEFWLWFQTIYSQMLWLKRFWTHIDL